MCRSLRSLAFIVFAAASACNGLTDQPPSSGQIEGASTGESAEKVVVPPWFPATEGARKGPSNHDNTPPCGYVAPTAVPDSTVSTDGTCSSNADCAADHVCNRHGACTGVGDCVPRPTRCETGGDFVCSCEGIPYHNECDALADGRDLNSEWGARCVTTGHCSDWRVEARGDCSTSLGWYYSPTEGCIEFVGCWCVSLLNGCVCGSETPLYGSRVACQRAHGNNMCGQHAP